ncbi:MAG: PLDc N-terminal domain-containing protein [bacterium]
MPEKVWLIAPLVVLQLGLLVGALVDLVRRKPKRALVWGFVIVLFSIIGPVLYFALGRKEGREEEEDHDL